MTTVCPSCGNKGEATIDGSGAFEVRGKFEGKAVRKCRKCDVGLLIGPFSGGLFGRPVQLQSGQVVTADEAYLREAILDPGAKVVAGYENIMPTFKGLVTEEGILDLVAYIRSLAPVEKAGP